MKKTRKNLKTPFRALLDKRNMTAVSLSLKVGSVSARALQSYAQGTRKPSYEVARIIEKTLGVREKSLFPQNKVWKK